MGHLSRYVVHAMRQIARFDSTIPLVFDCSRAQFFIVLLRSTVTQARVKNITPGVLYTFMFLQKGGHSFTWPEVCRNGMAIDPKADTTTIEHFIGNENGYMDANVAGTWF